MQDNFTSRIESETDVKAYIQNLIHVFLRQKGKAVNMRTINIKKQICPCCMEEHEVKTVQTRESVTFKDVKIVYDACYLYCENADEFFTDEEMTGINDSAIKDAYRKAEGLLTSEDIINIREKYGITQSDLCTLLGWGGKTITRYESHQVQDKAHDSILRKLDQDPEWFISLLAESKSVIRHDTYHRCMEYATRLFAGEKERYLRKAIEAEYAPYHGNMNAHGNSELSLDKAIDVIRFFAASRSVTGLYKVKLMKLMWYADALSYKTRGHAVTGLVYKALPMGAVPVGHNSLIELKNVPCEEVDLGENSGFYFSLKGESEFPFLSDDDKEILKKVAKKLGKMKTSEIVEYMHNEKAYNETSQGRVIDFIYAKHLQI